MKTGLQLRTSQSLVLTPQLQQALRLLQLSGVELQQELQQMLADNPFLERTDAPESEAETYPEDAPETQFGDTLMGETDAFSVMEDDSTSFSTVDASTDDWSRQQDAKPLESDARTDTSGDTDATSTEEGWDGEASSSYSASADSDDDTFSDYDTAHASLYDHLHGQALALRLEEADQAALYCLIESLNENGYLEESLGELAEALQQQLQATGTAPDSSLVDWQHHLTVALRLLRTLDPPGVGARDLGECLRLQLKAMRISDAETALLLAREVALEVCQQPLEHLARRDVRSLQQHTGFSAAQIQSAMQLIATLEPKPGRCFANVEQIAIVPDVLVRRATGAQAHKQPWQVDINPDVLPKVRVHEVYAQALRQSSGGDAGALQQRLQEARWMVRSLQQRFDTILRVSKAIVQKQQGFFDEGVHALQPLVLREIAEELEMHESTVSRVCNGKYLASPRGTFELKYFFSSALASNDGSAGTSSTAVRALLQELIANESATQPLSDQRLCELLQERGIQCARRTVAKYREALKIPPAHLRKSLEG
ncbi:MAG: RNA polymerase factor sigma-54 [Brachymonas sp.]|nr:RNA polymerase factor sigma-54 [Brachymonas sp.]